MVPLLTSPELDGQISSIAQGLTSPSPIEDTPLASQSVNSVRLDLRLDDHATALAFQVGDEHPEPDRTLRSLAGALLRPRPVALNTDGGPGAKGPDGNEVDAEYPPLSDSRVLHDQASGASFQSTPDFGIARPEQPDLVVVSAANLLGGSQTSTSYMTSSERLKPALETSRVGDDMDDQSDNQNTPK